MGANPPSNIPLVIRPPTRLAPTPPFTLTANGGFVDFVGSNGRQDRIQIVVTNMDPALYIYWGTLSGAICGAIFAQLPWTLETSADIRLINPQGSDITVIVSELYPDIGNMHGVPQRLAKQIAGGAPAGGGTTSGGTKGGTSGGTGTTGGTSGGTSPGGTQPR